MKFWLRGENFWHKGENFFQGGNKRRGGTLTFFLTSLDIGFKIIGVLKQQRCQEYVWSDVITSFNISDIAKRFLMCDVYSTFYCIEIIIYS